MRSKGSWRKWTCCRSLTVRGWASNRNAKMPRCQDTCRKASFLSYLFLHHFFSSSSHALLSTGIQRPFTFNNLIYSSCKSKPLCATHHDHGEYLPSKLVGHAPGTEIVGGRVAGRSPHPITLLPHAPLPESKSLNSTTIIHWFSLYFPWISCLDLALFRHEPLALPSAKKLLVAVASYLYLIPVLSATAEIPEDYIELSTCWSRPFGSPSASHHHSVLLLLLRFP